jgi:hypothetical protein
VQLVRTQVASEPLGIGKPDLADEDARLVVGVGDLPPRAVDVVDRVAVLERVRLALAHLPELGIRLEQRRRVDAEAGRAAVEPEAEHVLVLGAHVGV